MRWSTVSRPYIVWLNDRSLYRERISNKERLQNKMTEKSGTSSNHRLEKNISYDLTHNTKTPYKNGYGRKPHNRVT